MIYTPPMNTANRDRRKPSIFLAGSIEMGKAEPWQDRLASLLSHKFNIFNPRRADWDSSWEQTIDNPQFSQQVTWELDNIKLADYVIMYFQPGTQSPISLLELGILAESKAPQRILVVCPEGFWRKGNVDVVCREYDICQFDSLEKASGYLLTNH